MSRGQLWVVLLLSEVVIAVLDVLLRPFGLFFAPLYFFPICCACWRLGLIGGVVAGIVSTAFVALVGMAVHDQLPASAIVANFLVNPLLLSFVATIVVGFRYSYDQQQHLATHDRYGHQAGDEILQAFAVGAGRILRQEDAFGRMGGDEFTVAMLLASVDDAHNLAESLQKRFSALLAKSGHPVTCSMGALIVPPGYHSCFTGTALMKLADQLMYEAKQGGRNRVCIASAV